MRGQRGFTLVELVTTLAIIAIVSVIGYGSFLKFRAPSEAKARGNAEQLREVLHYARIIAVGVTNNVIVEFTPASNFYEACVDLNADNNCTENEKAGLRIPMPDDVGGLVNGISLKNNAKFGTFTQGGAAHVATKQLSGTVSLLNGVYYQEAGATDIDTAAASAGMHTTENSPYRFVFEGSGSALGGTVYMYLKKDDENSFHYALNVTPIGRVSLYQWAQVEGAWRWKMK